MNHNTTQITVTPALGDASQNQASLVVIEGEELGKRIALDQSSITIGRSRECDLQISHPSISRKHCEIWQAHGSFWIRDLKSTNKTFVNNASIREAELNDQDLIGVGKSVLKFLSQANPEADYHDKLFKQATSDGLTHLKNRQYFVQRLESEVDHATRQREPLTLAYLDLDNFKQVNDQQGHVLGDTVLRQLARQLRSLTESKHLVARIGGEEFGILMPGCDIKSGKRLADHICQEVARAQFGNEDSPCGVTVSIGLATLQKGMDADTLYEQADRALYTAKSAGRNCVRINPGNPTS